MTPRSLVSIRQLDTDSIKALVRDAAILKARVLSGETFVPAKRHAIGLLFFENSTRTRVSFERAATTLGHQVVNFSGANSSLSKGETLKDTILTLKNERLDVMVVRHPASGAVHLVERYFGGPVINAGDGQHEHPTQALADALTIQERLGTLTGLKIAIVGDVRHSRVARSSAWLLSKFGNEVRFVGPSTLLPSNSSRLPGTLSYDLLSGLSDADIVMCLRLQKERMSDGLLSSTNEFTRLYQVNRSSLRSAKADVIVMHPGPINRGIEIDDATADGPHSAITDQVQNGIFVRMAALNWVMGYSQEEATK